MLWRLPAYCWPGLPRPTKSFMPPPERVRRGRTAALWSSMRGSGRESALGRFLFLFLAGFGRSQARRSRDVRDHEVAIRDRRSRSCRQGDVRDVDRVVDVEAGDRSGDLLRDVSGGDDELDLRAHDLEHAAPAQPRRLLAVDELDRDEEVDQAPLGEAEEVDMDRQVLDHVALDGTADHTAVLAVDAQGDEAGEEPSGLEFLEKLVRPDVDRLRGLAAAVDDPWYISLAACLPGGPLACPRARHGLENRCLSHDLAPDAYVTRPASKGAALATAAVEAISDRKGSGERRLARSFCRRGRGGPFRWRRQGGGTVRLTAHPARRRFRQRQQWERDPHAKCADGADRGADDARCGGRGAGGRG